MSLINCTCRCARVAGALIVSAILGVIAAFLQITAAIAITPMFLGAAFIVAAVFLLVLILAVSITAGEEACDCLCAILGAVLWGILGTILFAIVLLLVDIAAGSVISAILVGLLAFFFSLMLTGAAAYVRCIKNCET